MINVALRLKLDQRSKSKRSDRRDIESHRIAPRETFSAHESERVAKTKAVSVNYIRGRGSRSR